VKINVYPLDFQEFLEFKNIKFAKCSTKNHFDLLKKYLLEYMRFGAYPEVVLTEDENLKKIVLKSIVDSIFQKDLLKLIKEEKIFQLTKFVKMLRNNI
jgi:predicted AAA+ superfamily ATPase